MKGKLLKVDVTAIGPGFYQVTGVLKLESQEIYFQDKIHAPCEVDAVDIALTRIPKNEVMITEQAG